MQNILLKHYSEYLHALSVAAVQSKKFPFQQIFSLNYAQVSKPGPAAESFFVFFFFFVCVRVLIGSKLFGKYLRRQKIR